MQWVDKDNGIQMVTDFYQYTFTAFPPATNVATINISQICLKWLKFPGDTIFYTQLAPQKDEAWKNGTEAD